MQDNIELPINSLRLFDDSGNYISFLGGGGGALEDPEHMETDSTLNVSNNDGMCSSMNDALTPSRVNVVDPPNTSTPTCNTPNNSTSNAISVSPIPQIIEVTPVRDIVRKKPQRLAGNTAASTEEEGICHVVLEPEEDAPTGNSTARLVSKHARAMESLLGPSEDLVSLDKLHVELKSGVKDKTKKQLYVIC